MDKPDTSPLTERERRDAIEVAIWQALNLANLYSPRTLPTGEISIDRVETARLARVIVDAIKAEGLL